MASQRTELDAVLAGLVQGVFVVDSDQKLISINDAAAQLLEVTPEQAIGRHVEEVIQNDDLQRVVAESLRVDDPVEGHVVLHTGNGDRAEDIAPTRFVRVQDTRLHNARGHRIGTMVALQDVTRLRHLEEVRRDFVANVSHEIKTPITTVKATVETLLDIDEPDGDETQRFLQIISRQADRLHAIVEDLLTLARLEQDVEQQPIQRSPLRVDLPLAAAVDACQTRADDKAIGIEYQPDTDLVLPINQLLLEQAVVNLLDNAIKYSPAKSAVRLTVAADGAEATICVQDEGPGIDPQHLPRIFERFYRTDKARSRELGGTGLGLAIVKHVASAHGGRVSMHSEPGRGSTFRIHLPCPPSKT